MKQIPLMGFNVQPPPAKPPQAERQNNKKKRRKPSAPPPNRQQNLSGSSYSTPARDSVRQAVGTQKRRRKKRNYTLHYIIMITILIITLIVLSFTMFFDIKTITINAKIDGVDNEKIISQTNLKVGDSLLLINNSKIEKTIMDNSFLLDGVDIVRKFPSSVEINLIEAKPTIAIKQDRVYYFFSETMRLMKIEKTNIYPEITCYVGVKIPKDIEPGSYLKSSEAEGLEFCLDIHQMLKEKKMKDITYVDMKSDINVSLYYKEQIQIKVGTVTNLSYKLDSANRVIEQKITDGQIGCLDVQVERKAYFRQIDISLP